MALFKTVFQKQDGLPVSRSMSLQNYLQAGSRKVSALKACAGEESGEGYFDTYIILFKENNCLLKRIYNADTAAGRRGDLSRSPNGPLGLPYELQGFLNDLAGSQNGLVGSPNGLVGSPNDMVG